ncbi:hypothetical protein BCSAG_48640 [Bacillus cereus]
MRCITPVLAESYNAFRSYIEQHNLNTSHFSYINNGDNLRGYSGLIVTVGCWWRNERYRSMGFHDVLNSYVHTGRVSLIKGTWESGLSQYEIRLL